jgi:hypothetical protein
MGAHGHAARQCLFGPALGISGIAASHWLTGLQSAAAALHIRLEDDAFCCRHGEPPISKMMLMSSSG